MEEELFNNIFSSYYKSLLSFIYNYIGSIEEARDIAQEVFLAIFKNYEKLKNKEKLKSWIFKIATNKVISFLRWKRIRKILSLDNPPQETKDYFKNLIDNSTNIEHFFFKTEEIKRILNKLTEKEKLIILLRAQGFEIKEIASIIGINSSTVKVHIFNARNKIKDDLEGL